jgi:hypothetical protein
MKKNSEPSGEWNQPPPREAMLAEVLSLQPRARAERLAIAFGQSGHVDDEVVVTLSLMAWRAQDWQAADAFASVLLWRVTKHVKAHVSKNPSWRSLGGGAKATTDDFSADIIAAIFSDKRVPCHAEVAFGDYVYKRSLDLAGKLFAKKNSAGRTLDESTETQAQLGGLDVPPAASPSPEEVLVRWQQEDGEEDRLRRIREIVQGDELPERLKIAFTYRFYGQLRIDSTKDDVVTICKLMGVTEKTVTKYIDEAIAFIKKRL